MRTSLFLTVLLGSLLSPGNGLAGVSARTEWMGAYMNAHKVGWSFLALGVDGDYPQSLVEAAQAAGFEEDLQRGALLLHSRSSIEVTAYGGINTLEWSTIAVLHPDLSVHRFRFHLAGDDSSIQLSGHVEGPSMHLSIRSASSVNDQRIALEEGGVHLAESVPLLLAARLRQGTPLDSEILVFEPHQLSRSTWKVRLEEIENWDLPSGKEEVYRVRQEIGGFSPILWMSRTGEVYKEWAPFTEELGYLSFKESEEQARDRAYRNPSLLASLAPTHLGGDQPDLLYATSVPVPERIARSHEVGRMVVDLWNFELAQPIPESPFQSNLSRYPNLEPTAELPLRLEIHSPDLESENFPTTPIPTGSLPDHLQLLLAEEPLVQTHHPEIQRISREIVEGLDSPWEKAVAIFDWIAANIQTEFRITLPSAIEVLESRKGDCNEQSTLFAALARAAGVPTKICTGLVYQRDGFYYHAWNEILVSVSPEIWVPIDPALKQVRVDATHIKFGEGGLSEQNYLTGMIGRIRARIVEFDQDDSNRKADQTIRSQNSG